MMLSECLAVFVLLKDENNLKRSDGILSWSSGLNHQGVGFNYNKEHIVKTP